MLRSLGNRASRSVFENRSESSFSKKENRTWITQSRWHRRWRVKTALSNAESSALSQQHLAATGRLTAGVAHEIKNPLNFINNFSVVAETTAEDLLEELSNRSDIDWEEVDDLIEILLEATKRVVEHGKRADEIVKNMLLHARGKDETKIDVDVAHLIRDFTRLAVKGVTSNASEIRTEVTVELQKDLPSLVVPAQGLSRVIINLVTNACFEANEHAAVVDSTRDPKVQISASYHQDRGELQIRVGDTGRGVPEKQREKIFEPFFTTKSPNEGTGLGLSICRDIVAKSEGKLFVKESRLGGAAFIVEIPADTGVSI